MNEIAKVKDEEGKDINLFSFATKYCSFHFQKEDYPIYDKHVLKMLMYCKKNYGLKEFTGPRTKTDPIDQHPNFYDVMEDFQKRYRLEKYTLRQIEKYLWSSAKYKYKKILNPPN